MKTYNDGITLAIKKIDGFAEYIRSGPSFGKIVDGISFEGFEAMMALIDIKSILQKAYDPRQPMPEIKDFWQKRQEAQANGK